MHKMFSIFFKAILVLSAVFICAKIGLYQQALHKQKLQQISTKDNHRVSPEVLHRLNQLTDIPLIGSFYLEPKAEELIKLQRFEEGLQIANDLVESRFSHRSYHLWLSKAKAELGLKLYEECEESLSRASAYARGRWDDYRISLIMDTVNINKAFQTLRALKPMDIQVKKDKNKDYQRELLNRQNQVL